MSYNYNWSKALEINSLYNINNFTEDDTGAIYCCSSSNVADGEFGKIFKTTDNGISWVDITPINLIPSGLHSIFDIKYGNGILLATVINFSTYVTNIIKSTDNGDSWSFTSAVIYGHSTLGRFYNLLYLGGMTWVVSCSKEMYYKVVYVTNDNGSTWEIRTVSNAYGGSVLKIKKSDFNNTLYATLASEKNIAYSTDNGFSWKQLGNSFTVDGYGYAIWIYGGYIYVGTYNTSGTGVQIIKTVDGTTWEVVASPATVPLFSKYEFILDMVRMPNGKWIVSMGGLSPNDGDLYESYDLVNWSLIELGSQYEWFYSIFLSKNNVIYTGSGNSLGDACVWAYKEYIVSDTTPPVFNSVNIDTITYNSANLSVNSSEDGKVYYKILPRNNTATTSSEIKANPTGQANITANTTSVIPIPSLIQNYQYDCYVVAEDTVPNLQLEPTKIQFQTLLAPTKVNTPISNAISGIYAESKIVGLLCTTELAEIRYTIDGTEPTVSSQLYSFPITISTSATIKAKAFKTGYTESDTLAIGITIVPNIHIIPKKYIQTPKISIKNNIISMQSQYKIYYTTDGSYPNDSSQQYTNPFTLPQNTHTITAISYSESDDSFSHITQKSLSPPPLQPPTIYSPQ